MITPENIRDKCNANNFFSNEVEELIDRRLKDNRWDIRPFTIVTIYYREDIHLRLIKDVLEKYNKACWKTDQISGGDCSVKYIFYQDAEYISVGDAPNDD